MRHVQRVVGRDGVDRLYLRKKGLPAARLSAAWDTPELEREVAALITALSPDQAQPGTLREAIRTYERSIDFLQRAASTQYEYGLILSEFDVTIGTVSHRPVHPALCDGSARCLGGAGS